MKLKTGNIKIDEIMVGDLIRLEIDGWQRGYYGTTSTHRILITEIFLAETNVQTLHHGIEGVDLITNEKFSRLYDPQRMTLFLEAQCDIPSKK